jgi:O-antigen/teichoic acid export membrane protein
MGGVVLAAAAYLTLIPVFSFVGAGIGTAIVETTLAVALAIALRREGIRGLIPPTWWKVTIAAAVSFGTMRGLASMHLPWMLGMLAGGLVYLGILVLVGAIPLNYLRAVLKSPNPDLL